MGIHFDTTEAEYEALPGLRISTVKSVLESPAEYKHNKENPPSRDTFRIGNAVHDLALTEGKSTLLIDVPDWKTKAAREKRDAVIDEGKYPLNCKEHEEAQEMANALRKNKHLAEGLINGKPEVAVTGIDAQTFTPMKSRIDLLDIGARKIFDVKTVAGDVTPNTFPSHVARYRYHIQAAQYLDIVAAETDTDPSEWQFIFIAVKKKAPFLTFAATLDPSALQRGRVERSEGIARLRECESTGVWPGYDTILQMVTLPNWY